MCAHTKKNARFSDRPPGDRYFRAKKSPNDCTSACLLGAVGNAVKYTSLAAQLLRWSSGDGPRLGIPGSNPVGRTIFEVTHESKMADPQLWDLAATMGDQELRQGHPQPLSATLGPTRDNGGPRWRPATMGDLYYYRQSVTIALQPDT